MAVSPYDAANSTFCCGDIKHSSQGYPCWDSEGVDIPGGFAIDTSSESVPNKLFANITGFANTSYTNLMPWQATKDNDSHAVSWQQIKGNNHLVAVGAGVGAPLGTLFVGATAVVIVLTKRLRALRSQLESEVQATRGAKQKKRTRKVTPENMPVVRPEVRPEDHRVDRTPLAETHSRPRLELPEYWVIRESRPELGS